VHAAITIDDYMEFLIYTLEFRAMILEQLSDEMEKKYLASTPVCERKDGWGVVLKTCTIRDLGGLGLQHVGHTAQAIIQKGLQIAERKFRDQSFMVILGSHFLAINLKFI
jgi:hypothetical protein